MGVKVVVQPVAPISALECWRHLRLDGAFDDPPVEPVDADLIAVYLAAACQHAEMFTERSIGTQTLELALDRFPAEEIALPRGPVQSIVSVSYIDGDREEQSLDATGYTIDDYTDSAWLFRAADTYWPTTAGVVNAVKVRYIAGYQTPDADPLLQPLPPAIRASILLTLAHLYENREGVAAADLRELPLDVQALLRLFRLSLGIA